jgi:hypothetical protein
MISCIDPQNSRGVIGRHRIAPIGGSSAKYPTADAVSYPVGVPLGRTVSVFPLLRD